MKDKPWVMIYNWIDPLGRAFISDEDYTRVNKALKERAVIIEINGELLSLRNVTIRKNPDYEDKIKLARLREAIQKQEEQLKQKREKGLFDD